MDNYEDIKRGLKQRIMSSIDFSVEQADENIFELVDRFIMLEGKKNKLVLEDKVRLRRELFNSIRRLDILTEYLEQDDVTEIMVNGYRDIFVERAGRIESADGSFESNERMMAVVQQIVADCNRRINEANPIVDARLLDGSRVNIILNPVSLDGAAITIRKFPKSRMTMEKLIGLDAVSEEAAGFLELLVKARYNIFISGGTGSGKTTFLNVLSDYIPKDERIVTIEDSAELMITGVKNLVRLEAKDANVEGTNAVTIRDLIRASLRMRPDRVIVGEVRDAAVIDMITAMNTGHDGSISTGHANSCEDMMLRLETMYLMGMEIPVAAIRRQLASAIDVVIHLGRLRDKSRRVLNISEVEGMADGEIKLRTLYEFSEEDGREGKIIGKLVKVNDLLNTEKLKSGGVFSLYEEMLINAG